ncbi:MAG: type II toxin-antitoxin system HipA family toxin [Spirochaetaceae bacterium]|nr:type II toxin-antitoxin system HipA family toxin [Spirochaetaceae bacterium]
MVFRYDKDALRRPGARALSASLPLREAEYTQAKAMPFFAGLLPDGELKRRIADFLHVSETSTLRLLEALGGECAGTVSLIPDAADEERGMAEEARPSYEEISPEALEAMIRDADRRPLLAPSGDARLSLAGAQEKLPLLLKDRRWYLPRGGAPSSHILKPGSPLFPEIVQLGRPVLVVRRYDRRSSPDGQIERIHQEDFCQALGIMPDMKYQADGGPGFADIAKLVRGLCSNPLDDLGSFIDIAIFNLLIGNCDAHGKNFSLRYEGPRISFSPFYDLVSTTAWPELSTKLSMRFGKEYRLENLSSDDLGSFAVDIEVKPELVRDRAISLAISGALHWNALRELPELECAQGFLDRMQGGWDGRAARLGLKG